MIRRFDACDEGDLEQGLLAATAAAKRGELVVVPTESAYGVATDAFRSDGLAALRLAKSRDRNLPVPVLVGYPTTADGLVATLSPAARLLIEAFWPGPLTIVGNSQPSLMWEVGAEGDASVSIRMPLHPVALELARAVGPLALTGANLAGADLPRTAAEAEAMLGDSVGVYLDAGPSLTLETSTIVDITHNVPHLLREGAITVEQIREVCPELTGVVHD